MSGPFKPPSGWSWGSDRWARTDQYQSFNAKGYSDNQPFGGKVLSGDYLASLNARHLHVPENFRRELTLLAHERDPDLFYSSLLAFAERAAGRDQGSLAAEVYALCAESPNPELREAARARLEAGQGRGPWAARADGFLRGFAANATDPATILPMLAGTTAYRVFRAAGAASGTAFASEVSVFTLGSRALRTWRGENLSWDIGSFGSDLRQAALCLGVLKISGRAAEKFLPGNAFAWAAQYAGLWAAHRLNGQAATAADVLGSLVSLKVGSHLGARWAGLRFAQFNAELNLRGGRPRPFFPDLMPKAGFADVSSAALPEISGRTRLSKTAPRPVLMESKGRESAPMKNIPAFLATLPLNEIYRTLLAERLAEDGPGTAHIAALYQALSLRRGVRTFPEGDEFFRALGFQQVDSAWVPSEKALSDFFLVHVEPLIRAAKWGDQAGEGAELKEAIRYFAGDMTEAEVGDFLKHRFDLMVDRLAHLPEIPAGPPAATLPDQRRAYLRNGIRDVFFGTVRDWLKKNKSAPEAIWPSLLRYAEISEREEAEAVYGRLQAELSTSAIRSGGLHRALALAASLYRSNRESEARALIDRVLALGSARLSAVALDVVRGARDESHLNGALAVIRREAPPLWLLLKNEMDKATKAAGLRFGPADSVDEWLEKGDGIDDPILEFSGAELFLKEVLDVPELYREGMQWLWEFPTGSQALELYRFAAFHMPPAYTDLERVTLAQVYWEGLKKQKATFALAESMRDLPLFPPGDGFEHSRYFWRHALMVGDIYLTSPEEAIRRMGLKILTASLSRKTGEQAPVLLFRGQVTPETSREDPAILFLPALWRIESILDRMKHFPSEERELVLRESFDILKKIKTKGANSLNRATLIVDLAASAFRYGLDGLTREIMEAWEGKLEKQLERSLGKIGADDEGPKEIWPALRSEARLMFSLLRALAGGARGLDHFLEEAGKTGSARRGFSLADFLVAMDYVSREEVSSQLARKDEVLERFSLEIVRRFSAASPEERVLSWGQVIGTFKNLPVSPRVLDRIFLTLLKSTGSFTGGGPRSTSPAVALWQAGRPLAFLLGNPEFPDSEAFLLKLLSESLRKNPEPELQVVLANLDWVFGKISAKQEEP